MTKIGTIDVHNTDGTYVKKNEHSMMCSASGLRVDLPDNVTIIEPNSTIIPRCPHGCNAKDLVVVNITEKTT